MAQKATKTHGEVKAYFHGVFSNPNFWYALATILMGVLFIVGGVGAATDMMKWIVIIMGAVTMVFGIMTILGGVLFTGIGEIVVGLLLITFACTVVQVAFLVLAIGFIVFGVMGIIRGTFIWSSIGHIAIGILIFLCFFGVQYAWNVANILFYVVGGLMIVDGIVGLIPVFKKN